MKILCVLSDPELRNTVEQIIKSEQLHFVESADRFFEEYESFTAADYAAMICEVKDAAFTAEVGQIIRNQCPQAPSFSCVLDKTFFDPKLFSKNGYTDTFLLPLDKKSFVDKITEVMSSENLSKRAMKRVMAADFQSDSKLDFSTFVHLPLNNKFVAFSSKGEEFSQKKVDKLKNHSIGQLFIDQKNSDQFYEYVATQMKNADNSLSATERQEKLKDAVRGIFRDVFDQKTEDSFESGRELLDSCRKVVSSYIMGPGNKTDFHTRLLRSMGGGGMDYSHASDTSTIAAMFGMALGSEHVEDLAIAGFLHDLSLAQFPADYGYESNPEWSDELKKQFHEHPVQTLNTIKSKRMIISSEVEKMIAQHHEKANGKGFPKGLMSDRISREAQILSLADQFQYLTVAQLGKPRLEPLKAIEAIEINGSITPSLIASIKTVLTQK